MSNVDDQSSEAAGPLQARQLLYARGMAIVAIPVFLEGRYSLQSVISRKQFTVNAGKLQRGLQVQFPDKHNIEIIEVRKSE
jgi:hypothetical protein